MLMLLQTKFQINIHLLISTLSMLNKWDNAPYNIIVSMFWGLSFFVFLSFFLFLWVSWSKFYDKLKNGIKN